MPGGNTRSAVFRSPYPIYVASGSGARIVDVDGIEYLDFTNNGSALIHGHVHPAIVDAVTKQVQKGASFAPPTESEVQLAELLSSRVASIEHIRFTNSGTEAVMMAIKAARAYTGRPRLPKLRGPSTVRMTTPRSVSILLRRIGVRISLLLCLPVGGRRRACWPMLSSFPSMTPRRPSESSRHVARNWLVCLLTRYPIE